MGETRNLLSLLKAIEKGSPFTLGVKNIRPHVGVVDIQLGFRKKITISENVYNKIKDYLVVE